MTKIGTRSWATPLTIGAFFLMAVTGISMFFGVDRALMAEAHKWFSLFFLAGAGGHIAANFRPLVNHLKSRAGRLSVAAFTLVLAASFFSWGLITGPQLERPAKKALAEAPLSALANVTRTAPDVLLARLRAHGIIATSQESVMDVSKQYGVSPNRLLAIVFLNN